MYGTRFTRAWLHQLPVRWAVSIASISLLAVAISAAPSQEPLPGVLRPLSGAKLPPDDDVKCLQFELETGNLETGPSTAIMKAAPGCVVPPHYHTAVEQLMIVRGEVSTGMEGMSSANLGPGGFALMPSKRVHWFTCSAKQDCLMFVTFDRAYDIVWVKSNK
jgi:quercetin dioxygenase-like cupin family protein